MATAQKNVKIMIKLKHANTQDVLCFWAGPELTLKCLMNIIICLEQWGKDRGKQQRSHMVIASGQ